MLRLIHTTDLAQISHLPKEIVKEAANTLSILDSNYGVNRLYKSDLGGFVLVLENEADLQLLESEGLDIETSIPEFVDTITCSNRVQYTSTLYILSSDYSITLIMPLDTTPLAILKWKV